MNSVLVMERNDDLREILCRVLDDFGYRSIACMDVPDAIAVMQAAQTPLVVILSHGGCLHDAEQIFAALPTLPPHAYVLLSTHPHSAPEQWNAYTQTYVPVVSMPFDIDLLIERVAEAAERLRVQAFSTVGARRWPL